MTTEPMTGEPKTEPKTGEPTAPSYAAAIGELESILAELEDEALDVDRLAERVARAAELIRLCRDRITGTRATVEEIVRTLDPSSGPSNDPTTESPEKPLK